MVKCQLLQKIKKESWYNIKKLFFILKYMIIKMGWEKPLMEVHAKIICQKGGDILNVGFGLGIIE